MKKFLTVLLALSVVFTYTVGSAFAATVPTKEQEEALKNVAEDVKGSFAYYSNGYMKAEDNAKYLSQTVVNAGVDKIVDKYMKDIDNAPADKGTFKVELLEGTATWIPGHVFVDAWDEAYWSKDTYYMIVSNYGNGNIIASAQKYNTFTELQNAAAAAQQTDSTARACVAVKDVTGATYTTLLQEQYKVERDAAYAALSPDLSNYSDTAKKAIEEVIDAQTTAIENVVKVYEATTKTAADSVAAIDGFKAAVDAIDDALDQDTVTDDNEKIAEARKAATKALNEKSDAFKEAAEDHYKAETSAQAVSRLESLDADVDAMVAFFEAAIEATVLDEKDEKLDTAKDVVDALEAIQKTLEDTFKVNSPYDDAEFYTDLSVFDEADVLKAYAEKEAADMKALVNADGSYTYHSADVDVALAEALENIADQTYVIIADTTHAADFDIDELVNEVLDAVEKTNNAYYALRKYKADAIEKVTGYDADGDEVSEYAAYKKDNWSYDRYDKVVALQKQAAEDILKAETTDAIDAIVEKAQDDMDKILTKNQITDLNTRTGNRLTALGYKGATGVLEKYYDVAVGSKGYSSDIKDDAIDAAIAVFEDAVVAAEDKDITYAEIDKIIADNRDEALAAITNVKTVAELDAQAAALKAQFAALPKEVTLADKDTVLAAMTAFENYLAQPGTDVNDVSNDYLLENAMYALMTLEVKAVKDQIRALPDKITVADEAAIEAARAAYDALFDTYGNYDDGKDAFNADTGFNYYGSKLNVSNAGTLTSAEDDLEVAKVKDAADKIAALKDGASKAEVEAARAAYEALSTESKLAFKDELYAALVKAEANVKANIIASVESLKIVTSTKLYTKSNKIRVNWKVKDGDASAITGYQVYKSTKAQTGYKFMGKTTKSYMDNKKNLKKGQRYFYKVRAYVDVDGERHYSDWSNKGNRIYK